MNSQTIFTLLTALLLIAFSSCREAENETAIDELLSYQLKTSIVEVETIINEQLENNIDMAELRVSPRSVSEQGELNVVRSRDWTSGFFPGNLWFMYEWTEDEYWLEKAKYFTSFIEQEKYNNRIHDMGFKIYCSFGAGYRLTGDPHYRDVMIHSANTLITRFSETVGSLRSWDHNTDKWDFPVIIDNMMNLELLFWATRVTGDSIYYDIAVRHADLTLREHFRDDASSYHVIDFNPDTGEVQNRNTHQGFAHESAWARGQAWGLYGFTMSYRETGIKEYLDKAIRIADFVFNHPNLPEDLVPYWDFNAPNIPNEPRDVSAATIIASALYELSTMNTEKSSFYRKTADAIIDNVEAYYMSEKGENFGFILTDSTGHFPHGYERAVPIIYADYYFLEALLRRKNM